MSTKPASDIAGAASDPVGGTTIVVGASSGLGRGIAAAMAQAGAPVVAVALTASGLEGIPNGGAAIRLEVADATDPTVAADFLDRYEPGVVILVADANPGPATAAGEGAFLTPRAGLEPATLRLTAGCSTN